MRKPLDTEHRDRHELLHQHLDELAADFIQHTGHHLSKTTVLELLAWSNEQRKNPSPDDVRHEVMVSNAASQFPGIPGDQDEEA